MKFEHLAAITGPMPIDGLSEEQLRELQVALSLLGYPVGDIDGLIGPRTRTAWAEFKTDVFEGNPTLIGPLSIQKLQEKLDKVGEGKAHDFSTKQGTIEAIKSECEAQGLVLNTQIAYVLATVEWETAKRLEPVREAFWRSEEWRRSNLRYYPFYGRGYVQLTWKNNYEKYSHILGVDLVSNPDGALEPEIALFILVHGFKTGTFTGRKISDYINANITDFVNARRCINGTDHDNDIARLAEKYLRS
ncbi:MAG: carboxypeptidase [Acidobacteria bacterium]|nr:carboxypeptidase [Acidobacteriota bacterium]